MTTSPTPAHTPSSRVALRMQLLGSPSTRHIGGVWWPQSRDLQVEAADLVDHFPDQVGHIDRLLFAQPDWDDTVVDGHGVRLIQARRGPVKVGSFPSDDTQLMIVLLASGQRVSLKVLASATDAVEAERQFRALDEGGATETAQARSRIEEPRGWM